ncbi:MAG: hypothetical protein WBV82_28810 [Myxococcaceae bacterium]
MKPLVFGILVVCLPALATAQAPASAPEDGWMAPPLVEAPPQPPLYVAPPSPEELEQPGPEIGLMASETAFGMLTAAGSSLLTYFLLVKPLQAQASTPGDRQLADIMFLIGFGAVPLAVSQTQVGIANESRFYSSEGWPAALSGLGAQAAVVGLYYLVRQGNADHGEPVLLIGTIVGVPLVEMAVINLTKKPRRKQRPTLGAVLTLEEGQGLQAGLPLPTPAWLPGAEGPLLGLQLPLLQGRF